MFTTGFICGGATVGAIALAIIYKMAMYANHLKSLTHQLIKQQEDLLGDIATIIATGMEPIDA